MRRYLTKILVILLGISLLMGTGNIFAQTKSSITLRLGHNAATESHTHKASLKFAELVSQKTDDRVKLSIYPANQLGGNRELAEQVSTGALDITIMGLGAFGYMQNEYNVMQLPYLFRSQEHIHKYIKGPAGKRLAELMIKNHRIRPLSQTWDRMPRHISTNKPIISPEDVKGMILRVGTKGVGDFYKLIGARPSHIPLNEMYLALKQKVVDGAELPLDYFYDYSIYEVNQYLSLVYHIYGTQMVGMSELTFQRLPSDVQKALIESAEEAGELNNKLCWETEDDYLKKLQQKGMKVVKSNYELFVEALDKVIPQLEKLWPGTKGMYEEVRQVR